MSTKFADIPYEAFLEPYSLDAPINEDSVYGDFVQCGDKGPEDIYGDRAKQHKIHEVLRGLPKRTQLILYKRFWEDQTLEEIGETYGLCRERVRQIILEAWKEIKPQLSHSLKGDL